jgi:plastocyanin
MRLRKQFLYGVTALLGVASVAVPAAATSETTPAIKAVNGTGIYEQQTHSWSPPEATITSGATIALSNPSAVKHGVHWVYGPATPECSGVPVGTSEAASGTEWSGTCKFTTPGVYTFYCTVHGAAMAASITVNANGQTTSASTPPTQTATSTATGAPPAPSGAGAGATLGSAVTSGSPLADSAARAIKLPARQRGSSVHGSIDVSPAGAGGQLEVQLLVNRASLASVAHATQLRVGRVVKSSLAAGVVSFTVPLDARAKRALRSHRHLRLTVKLRLTPLAGSTVTISRTIALHA